MKSEFKDFLYSILLLFVVVSVAIRRIDVHYILAIIIGFFFHELSHRMVARHFGFKAHYKAYKGSIFVSLFMAFFGFLFLAPGAVYVEGYIGRREMGKVALAGPFANIIISLISLYPYFVYGIKAYLAINSIMALFNMIPSNPFDGKKVYDWNKTVFYVTLIVSFGLFLV